MEIDEELKEYNVSRIGHFNNKTNTLTDLINVDTQMAEQVDLPEELNTYFSDNTPPMILCSLMPKARTY